MSNATDSSVEESTVSDVATRTITRCVGTFVAFGVGFVLTLFLAAQFVTDGSGTALLVGGVGAGSGFAFAVLLSPFVAVLLGVLVGREDGENAVVNAALGSALGFVVMFFVTLVLAASLAGSGSGGLLGAGPLVGFTVGTGLTGAATAFVTRVQRDALAGVTDHSLRDPVVLGVGLFVAFAVGYAVTVFLASVLSGGQGGTGLGSVGLGSVAVALVLGLLFAPVVALLVGTFVGRDAPDASAAAVGGGTASGLGALALVVVVYVLVAVLQPDGVTTDALPLGPLLGFVVGTGLTGAITGYATGR